MKFSLISATSVFALLSASIGSGHASLISTAGSPAPVFDLARGPASEGAPRSPSSLAVAALGVMGGGLQTASSTGKVDYAAAAGMAYPAVPMGAAAGTQRDETVSSSVVGMSTTDPVARARAVGQARMMALIGTVDGTTAKKSSTGATVFVAAGSLTGFGDGDSASNIGRGTAMAATFAPSSSSTATITIAGAGNLSRQRNGGATYMADGKPMQATTLARGETISPVMLSANAAPATGYRYTPGMAAEAANATAKARLTDASSTPVPQPDPANATRLSDRAPATPAPMTQVTPTKQVTTDVPASFGGGVTATGTVARVVQPMPERMVDVVPASTVRIQTSQAKAERLQTSDMPAAFNNVVSATGQMARVASAGGARMMDLVGSIAPMADQTPVKPVLPNQMKMVDASVTYKQLLDYTRNMEIARTEIDAYGSQVYLSASVSANPTANIVRFLATISGSPAIAPAGRSVEAFQVHTPTNGRTFKISTIDDPLSAKVLASAGPLNSALALP